MEDLLHKCTDMKDFSDKLQGVTMYYFWSKCEWETVIHPWVGDEKAAKKIDVFWQLQNNWDRFVEYLWEMNIGYMNTSENIMINENDVIKLACIECEAFCLCKDAYYRGDEVRCISFGELKKYMSGTVVDKDACQQ